ncbi:MAG: NAD(+)/NADH kinase, partial [Lachnospiraceae bacterium]|nr:NAD(+)/NADH kinase [Lachnospiraceae bacterium]
MRKFYIYTNTLKDPTGVHTKHIRDYLQLKGCVVSDKIDETVDGMLVLGGDGTMLRAAKEYVGSHVPMIGVNLGTLGYLAEVEWGELESAIDSLIDGHYDIESRMMLSGIPVVAGESMMPQTALNDIVISRKGALHV